MSISRKEQRHLYYLKNKEKIITDSLRYYQEHKEECQIRNRKYQKKNCKILSAKALVRSNKRRKIDLNYKLANYLRNRLYCAINGIYKSKSALILLGCSIDELKQHLEKQFNSGMSWTNYGQWHIDHIKPCSKFDLTKEAEQKLCFHYTNLQPLWAIDNFRKNNNYD